MSLFSEVAWAGDRTDFGRRSPLISAGIGAGFLDAPFRIDLAAGLKDPTGFRLEVDFDGML